MPTRGRRWSVACCAVARTFRGSTTTSCPARARSRRSATAPGCDWACEAWLARGSVPNSTTRFGARVVRDEGAERIAEHLLRDDEHLAVVEREEL